MTEKQLSRINDIYTLLTIIESNKKITDELIKANPEDTDSIRLLFQRDNTFIYGIVTMMKELVGVVVQEEKKGDKNE